MIFQKPLEFNNDSIKFEIPKNSDIRKITEILRNKGLNINEYEFKITAKWFKLDSKLRYGRFILTPHKAGSLKELVYFLTKNGSLTRNVTIPEGSRIIDIANILKRKMGIDSLKFVQFTKDPLKIKELGILSVTMEGYLYPETYNFNENDDIGNIVEKMYAMYKKKTEALRPGIENSEYSENEIITLASIIQAEVMVRSEMKTVSAVYNNRLDRGMLLQADPTVQYLFTKPRRLLNKHIEIDSPYNTYLYPGLPPGPINNPSADAVKAALFPADVPYLYMVAKGDGTHYFNTYLKDHINDKKKLDKLRIKHRMEKRRTK